MKLRCPACLGDEVPLWVRKNGYDIRRCVSCGFGFVDPVPDAATLREWYAERSYGEENASRLDPQQAIETEAMFPNAVLDSRRMIRRAAKMLGGERSSKSLLDVGSGFGFASRVAQEEGFSVSALEIARSGRETTAAVAHVKACSDTFEDYETDQYFDVILMSQVIEHVADINVWAEKAGKLLSAGGILVLAMPNLNSIVCKILRERDPYINPPMHLGYFTPKAVRLWLGRYAFDEVSVHGVSRMGPRTLYRRLPFIPEQRTLIRWVRCLQDAPFRFFGLLGFPIMLNVYARKRNSPTSSE